MKQKFMQKNSLTPHYNRHQTYKTQTYKTQTYKTQTYKTQTYKTQTRKTQDHKTQTRKIQTRKTQTLLFKGFANSFRRRSSPNKTSKHQHSEDKRNTLHQC